MTIFDDNFWWHFLMTISDDNCWWQFWQSFQIFGKFSIFLKVFVTWIGNLSHFEAAQRNAGLSLAMFMRMEMRNFSQVKRETFPPEVSFLLGWMTWRYPCDWRFLILKLNVPSKFYPLGLHSLYWQNVIK